MNGVPINIVPPSHALELFHLANRALVAGFDMGFSAAEVIRWIDPKTFEPRLAITWGDQLIMKRPRLRTPCEYALSYDEEASCIRAPRTIEFSDEIRLKSVDALTPLFHEKLLELA